MNWRSVKLILASTATAAVISQVALKLYRKFTSRKSKSNVQSPDDNEIKPMECKDREVNDVIIFSDQTMFNSIKMPQYKDLKVTGSRELNCFKLIRYLKAARETLDVCMYLITSNEIAEHIIRLGQKHVLVRILVDNDMAFTNGSQFKRFQQYSFINIQASQTSSLMHHKFCVIDGPSAVNRKNQLKANAEKLNVFGIKPYTFCKKRYNAKKIKGFVMSGSLNWSTEAMVGNYDNVIVTSNENVVAKFEKEFTRLWIEDERDSPMVVLAAK